MYKKFVKWLKRDKKLSVWILGEPKYTPKNFR